MSFLSERVEMIQGMFVPISGADLSQIEHHTATHRRQSLHQSVIGMTEETPKAVKAELRE